MSSLEIISLMNEEDRIIADTIKKILPDIARAVEDAIYVIRNGGSLIYIGAGTSGRLGVLDCSEMYPTFNIPDGMVKAIIAGGSDALTRSIEGAEDDKDAGCKAVEEIRDCDMLVGISAGGGAPFVLSALGSTKARRWLITCSEADYGFLDGIIRIPVGPEVIAGSSRLKAGTATKMVLNMLSTATMVRLGRVYKGYMVDVVPCNDKLVRRAVRIIDELTGCGVTRAGELLEESGRNPKRAILMELNGLTREEAETRLESARGSLRNALVI